MLATLAVMLVILWGIGCLTGFIFSGFIHAVGLAGVGILIGKVLRSDEHPFS